MDSVQENNMRALVFGATGLVGSELLDLLRNATQYKEVLVFSRKPMDSLPSHFKNIVAPNFLAPELKNYFQSGDRVFCCIGTTRKKTPDLTEYKKIDHDIPVFLAACCAEKDCAFLLVVSAIGANAGSSNFYTRMKGEMQHEVTQYFGDKSYFFQPSLLLGNRKEFRLGEKVGIVLFQLISPLFVGKLKRYQGIEARKVAEAMMFVAQKGYGLQHIPNELMLEGLHD